MSGNVIRKKRFITTEASEVNSPSNFTSSTLRRSPCKTGKSKFCWPNGAPRSGFRQYQPCVRIPLIHMWYRFASKEYEYGALKGDRQGRKTMVETTPAIPAERKAGTASLRSLVCKLVITNRLEDFYTTELPVALEVLHSFVRLTA